MSQNRIHGLFGTSKGTLYYKKKGYPVGRKSHKERPPEQVSVVRKICGDRPTYGVPRVRRIAERDYGEKMSYHRVYSIMEEEGLLISKTLGQQSRREHTGKISVEEPNTRWASDITSIKLWDGLKARFTYVLDCCDRSIIAWRLGLRMQAVDIEQMIEEAILTRFSKDQIRAPGLEFLHDNGPEYVEKVFRKRLLEWDVVDCHTPSYSPESNGICEAFNGTFKRDYVYQGYLDNIDELRKQIEKWVADYNTFAPHSALGMKTPAEFFKLRQAA